jgi:biotin operon repressor
VTRSERLLALVAELRAAAPARVATRTLAELLRVSERTVQRDLTALARDGLPVRTTRDGYTIAAGPPPPAVTGTASLARPIRDTIAHAVRIRRVVRIAYVDQAGERTRRDVEAHGLVTAPYGEYLVGWCRLREGPRLFRLDRIGAAYLTGSDAGLRDLDELLATLRVPAPRRAIDDGPGAGTPARARAWTLDRVEHVRVWLAETAAEARTAGEGIADLRAVIGHLAEWSRWQIGALRAVATGEDLIFDGRRPPFPPEFDRDLPYPRRERMIQDAMAVRSFGEVARDLDDVLDGAAHWTADCPDELWRGTQPEPGRPGEHRPLADLMAGWWSPLSHIEWHLDRLTDDPGTALAFGHEPDDDTEPAARLVERCPLRR